MAQFKVTVMNWVPLCVSPATVVIILCHRAHHLGLVSPMEQEEENGQNKILCANVRTKTLLRIINYYDSHPANISGYLMVHTFSFVIQQPLFNLHPS